MADHAAKVAKKDGTSRKPRKEKPRALRSIAPTAIPAGMRRALPAGPGEPLPRNVLDQMGARFGIDFRQVRTHRDSAANTAAADQGANAFTLGHHVVFAEGRFAPGTREGERLIAHELTHVLQQSRGGPPPPMDANGAHEHAADQVAMRTAANPYSECDTAVESGEVAAAGATGLGIARDDDKKKKKPSPAWSKGLTPEEKRDLERKKEVLEQYDERAHDDDAELSEERVTRRKGSSERARHRERSQDIDLHHGFPKFIGGNKIQTYIKFTKELHYLYHEELYYLLEKELKVLGKLPKDAGRASRKYYGRMVRALTPAQQKELQAKIIQHAKQFDDRYRKTHYPDKRQRLEAAVRRGIKEANQAAKPKAKAKKSAPPAKPKAPPPKTPPSGKAPKGKTPKGKAPAKKGGKKPSAGTPAKPAPIKKPAQNKKPVQNKKPASPAKAPAPVKPATPAGKLKKENSSRKSAPPKKPAAPKPAATKPSAPKAPPKPTTTGKSASVGKKVAAPVKPPPPAPAKPVAQAKPPAPNKVAAPPPKAPIVPKGRPVKPPGGGMRAPRLGGMRSFGRGMAGAAGAHALGYLAAMIQEKFRQDQMEELIDKELPPAVEAGMNKIADQVYTMQIQKPGVPLYWNVTFKLVTVSDMVADQGTANMNPKVTSVALSWENKNSTTESTSFGIGTSTDTTTITYSFPAEEIPFEDLAQYAASQDMDMSALRKYAESKIAALEHPDPNVTFDPVQQQDERNKWSGRLQNVEEYAAGVKLRKEEKALQAKIAEDKRSEERFQQVLEGDRAKSKQPLAIPFFSPPGGTPGAQAPMKIGPFDLYGDATAQERGELIAAHFERKRDEWVAYSKKVHESYDAGTLSDEDRKRFREARDRWISSVNSYEAAMSAVPEMHAGAERMKALKDWLANDGHNALLIGM